MTRHTVHAERVIGASDVERLREERYEATESDCVYGVYCLAKTKR